MRKNEDIDFEIPLIISDHLREKTGKPVFPVGLGETPETSFIEISLSGLTYSNQLTRTADFVVWVYTPISEGLEQSFIEGDELRKALNSSVWGVKTLQSLQIENGNILTDSPYPSFYAQEIMFWATYVHKPLPAIEVEPPYEPEPMTPFQIDVMYSDFMNKIVNGLMSNEFDEKGRYNSPLGTVGIIWTVDPTFEYLKDVHDYPFIGAHDFHKDFSLSMDFFKSPFSPLADKIRIIIQHPNRGRGVGVDYFRSGRVEHFSISNPEDAVGAQG